MEDCGGGAGARVADGGKGPFLLMEERYLRDQVVGMAPAEDAEWMGGVVLEAMQANAARGNGFVFELLGPKALDHGVGVIWGEYANRGERRLEGNAFLRLEGNAYQTQCDGGCGVRGAAVQRVDRRVGSGVERDGGGDKRARAEAFA